MATVAAATPRRRGGRLLIALAIVASLVAGGLLWLNVAAQAGVNVSGTLTVYQRAVSISHRSSPFTEAKTGAAVRAGDSVKTDSRGRAGVVLPDGTWARLATDTTLGLDSAHFSKQGNLNDVHFTQQIGRTFIDLQHLVGGATFDLAGSRATATVRGTKFEVHIKANEEMMVKVFAGMVTLHNAKGSVTIDTGRQATANPDGSLSEAIPIQPDPSDPFGPSVLASDQVMIGTTPGTEQDYIGAPLHDGEQQQYTYSYAGGSLVKAAVGYSGSGIRLTVRAPDGQQYMGAGAPPIVVNVKSAPAGIYAIFVDAVGGLGAGGEPFLAVASVESCTPADTDQNGAIHRGYSAQDLVDGVRSSGVPGLSNLNLNINHDSRSGAIISGSGSYNGMSWSATVVLTARDGALAITPVDGNMFGLSVPAQQVVQQIAQVIGQDPDSVDPGFRVDRLFTCKSVLMLDGQVA